MSEGLMREPVSPEDCPEPYNHQVFRYCPCCSWVSEDQPPSPRKQALQEAAAAIREHADKWAPAEGNEVQRRMRRHLLIAERVVLNIDGPDLVAVAAAFKEALS